MFWPKKSFFLFPGKKREKRIPDVFVQQKRFPCQTKGVNKVAKAYHARLNTDPVNLWTLWARAFWNCEYYYLQYNLIKFNCFLGKTGREVLFPASRRETRARHSRCVYSWWRWGLDFEGEWRIYWCWWEGGNIKSCFFLLNFSCIYTGISDFHIILFGQNLWHATRSWIPIQHEMEWVAFELTV